METPAAAPPAAASTTPPRTPPTTETTKTARQPKTPNSACMSKGPLTMETVQQVNAPIHRRDVLEHPTYNRFKHVMTYYIGGPLVLISLLGIGGLMGYCSATSRNTGKVTPPPAAPPPTSAPVQQPQVIVIPQPVQQVAYPPAMDVVKPSQVEKTQPLTDAERRNEARKERLRSRYGID